MLFTELKGMENGKRVSRKRWRYADMYLGKL